MTRRRLLKLAAAASVLIRGESWAMGILPRRPEKWNQGELVHLIPIANHEQMLIKSSFTRPQKQPYLQIADQLIAATMSDSGGRFWQFHVNQLEANTTYSLQLRTKKGEALCDSWELSTFPAPESSVQTLRILAYTCAGGNDALKQADGTPFFLSMPARQQLLERGLSFQPDVVIANGDHIYWDQKTSRNKPESFSGPWLEIFKRLGTLDPKLPPLGSANEQILTQIVNPQIAMLYGVRLRSTPTYMLTDDHDLFENDEANEELITLPPTQDKLSAARAVQYLYYPEFLADANRPDDLPGSSNKDRVAGLSETYGTLRYGKLLEALLYDTKRYVSLDGEEARFFPESTEDWLAQRTGDEDTAHLLHIPSTPIGWSAGKWGEWYPDIRQKNGTLGLESPKPFWPKGWWLQHQRLLAMLSAQKKRAPVIASGDLHALSYGQIIASGDLDCSDNPIHSFCIGPLGSSGPGFPTKFRGIGAKVPTNMKVDELLKPIENNGFTIIDISPGKMLFKMYKWLPPQPISQITDLQPFATYQIAKPISPI